MIKVNRRELSRFGAGAIVAMLAASKGFAQGATAPGDPAALRYVDPELLPSARKIYEMSAIGGEFNAQLVAQMRNSGDPFAPPMLADVPVQELKVPVGKGAPDVTIYIINARAGETRPGILHTHGGGYILGAAKAEVSWQQALARTLDCIIITVEYRLAPETRYTGSIEDNYAALRWMHKNAGKLGLDPARIAVMGESAGGGHAARLAITARDRGEVPLALQVLIYPMLDDRTGSSVQLPPFIGAFGWTAQANRFAWGAFLGQAPGGPDVPADGVPARVSDLAGLPPAFLGVGGVDLFVREDIDYARRLTEAGVATELMVLPGAYHGFDRVAPETSAARRLTGAKLNALHRAFGQPSKAIEA